MEYTIYKNDQDFCWADNINIKYYKSLAAKEHSVCEKNISIDRKNFLKLFLAVGIVSNAYTEILKLSIIDVESIVILEFEKKVQLELFNKDIILFNISKELVEIFKII